MYRRANSFRYVPVFTENSYADPETCSLVYEQRSLSLKHFKGKTLPVSAWLLFDIFICEKFYTMFKFYTAFIVINIVYNPHIVQYILIAYLFLPHSLSLLIPYPILPSTFPVPTDNHCFFSLCHLLLFCYTHYFVVVFIFHT